MTKYISTTKEWRDTVNGNSYFSTRIEDVQNDKMYILPFQYGYGTQSEHEAKKVIKCFNKNVSWDDIEFIKHDKCSKRSVTQHGQGIEENYISNPGYYYQD
jgi:hypothetical protein